MQYPSFGRHLLAIMASTGMYMIIEPVGMALLVLRTTRFSAQRCLGQLGARSALLSTGLTPVVDGMPRYPNWSAAGLLRMTDWAGTGLFAFTGAITAASSGIRRAVRSHSQVWMFSAL